MNKIGPCYFTVVPMWPKSYHTTGPKSTFLCHLVRHRTLSKTLSYRNSGKIHLSKFSIQTKNFSSLKVIGENFVGEFYVIISSLVKCKKQPDNGGDRYAAKCKHCLGSEHTFKHTAEFLQSSFYRPRVAARAPILHASNETQRINVWLLFLIAITDILNKEYIFRPLHFLLVYSQKSLRVD